MSAPEYERSCGCVVELNETAMAFAGSCFALWCSDLYVTAAHLLDVDTGAARLLDASDVAVLRPTSGLAPVVGVERHPDADLAVLHLEHDDPRVLPFEAVKPWPLAAIGSTVHHFGYSEER